MRADLMMWLAPKLSARATVLLVLMTDYEVMLPKTDGWGMQGRTLEYFQKFNARVTRWTLLNLQKEGLIEPEKSGWRLRVV